MGHSLALSKKSLAGTRGGGLGITTCAWALVNATSMQALRPGRSDGSPTAVTDAAGTTRLGERDAGREHPVLGHWPPPPPATTYQQRAVAVRARRWLGFQIECVARPPF